MSRRDAEQLREIRTFPSLVKYLRDELDWPIEADDFDELTFDWEPEELGIDPASTAKIKEIKQLRPLASNQPWGIFFVKFEPKRLPVVALRRILGQLVIKRRATAKAAERAVWHTGDLLFVSNYGQGDERRIGFAHFSHDEDKHDLPTLKVLGWDNLDTELHLDDVAEQLTAHLAWPGDARDIEKWRNDWRAAFTLRHREVITTSRELSIRLADLARAIRDRIKSALAIETERGPLTKLMKAFQEALVHDLGADGFADMYAQTIAYGLLSARIADPHSKTADDFAAHMRTNPFLKELMQTFLQVGGRRGKAGGPGIDFDELGVSEVVELLDDANMEAVVRDFGDRNPQEDPVTHFYEGFASEYDPIDKVKRGEFYTPRPVVSYIVRSVNELVRTEFGLADGLADITTWGEMAKRHKDLKIPEGASPDQAFIQILDPATGTGTFLVEVVDLIYSTLITKWRAQGHGEKKLEALWNEYVPKHLLPRLHAYELKMAPYAIAHLKIGLKLYETGYRFGSEERAHIYLTNALEPWVKQLPLIGFDALAHEAAAVNEIKRHKRFTIVIGNPPYSGLSANMSEDERRLVDIYKIVDGEALNERKLWLQDDYVKFIRTGQVTIEQTRVGILAFITNHGYLNNPTFRGMRQSLMHTFDDIHVLDLHGNAKIEETAPDGHKDENVFDIMQGVAVGLLIKRSDEPAKTPAGVFHCTLWGSRASKYVWLVGNQHASHEWATLQPNSPHYFFVPRDESARAEYESGWPLPKLMPVNGVGMVTARDALTIDFDSDALWRRVNQFSKLPADEARTEYGLGNDAESWKVSWAQEDVRKSGPSKRFIRPVLYRPFDRRVTYYTGQSSGFICRPVFENMRHMLAGGNLSIDTCRQIVSDKWTHVLATDGLTDDCVVSNKSRERGYLFPVYIYPSPEVGAGELFNEGTDQGAGKHRRRPNLSSMFVTDFGGRLGVAFVPEGEGDFKKTFGPEDVFHYAYSVFHSPGYRSRYAEFLKIDFPRLPLTGNLELFRALAWLGGELVALHLLESPKLGQPITEFSGGRNPEVEKVSWSKNTVWVDRTQTTGFKGVRENVWDFRIGSYRVCEKWLKDRKGRTLSKDDIAHYQKIVVALNETIRLMEEIDRVIEKHGGWPAAFASAGSSERP